MLTAAVTTGNNVLQTGTSQAAVDAAAAAILTAISELVPYLQLTLESVSGGVVQLSYAGQTVANAQGAYQPLFGDKVKLYAEPGKSFRFAGWYETVTHRILSTETDYRFAVSSNLNIRPLFVHSTAATLTFANANGYIAGMVTKTAEEWAAVTRIGPLSPAVPYHYGGTNGHWSYDNDAVLASLAAGQDVTVTCEYDEDTSNEPALPVPVNGIPALTLTLNYNENADVASYLMAIAVPDGCEVAEKGIAFKYSADDSFHPDAFDLTLDNKTTTSKFNTAEHSGVFVVNVRRFSSRAWAAKAYCTYYDTNHILRVVYSQQINFG